MAQSNLETLVSGLATISQVLTNIVFTMQTASNTIQKALAEGRDVTTEELNTHEFLFNDAHNRLKDVIKSSS